MIRVFSAMLFWTVLLFAERTAACGGGFGEQLEVDAAQTIIVRFRDGRETYVFNPRFCGAATDFGLILPVPGLLTEEPALASPAIYDALDEISAPEVVVDEVCESSPPKAGMDRNGSLGDDDTAGGGVDVVNSGQVGLFDWALLRADGAADFTDWLDANHYRYDQAAVEHFEHYVDRSWYFIAFKVTAGEAAPPEGFLLCGDFGPIRFAFPAEAPVIPARIAAVGAGESRTFYWRLHVFADAPMTAAPTVDWEGLRYIGEVTEAQIAGSPALSQVAEAGDLFTSVDVQFYGGTIKEDITLVPSDGPTEYRQTIHQTVYVDCAKKDGCTVVAPGKADAFGRLFFILEGLLF